MGHFSVEIYAPPGSTLSANQQSLVPNEKNVASSAISPAISAARGSSIIVPTRYSSVRPFSPNTCAATRSTSAFSERKFAWCNRCLEEHDDDDALVSAYTAKRAKERCGGCSDWWEQASVLRTGHVDGSLGQRCTMDARAVRHRTGVL